MKTRLLSLTLLAALSGSGAVFAAPAGTAATTTAVAASQSAPDPAIEIKQLAQLFRAGDLSGLAQALTPRSRWEAARASFEAQRHKPTSAEDRARFAEKLQRLTAPDAVDQMMAKLEPEMAKARPQLPGMMLMGFGALSVAINSPETELTDEQRQALRSAMPAVQQWAATTDFLSVATARRALTTLTDAVRQTGITDIDQLKALPLEGVLERAGPLLTAAKDAARNYGLDLDAVADSLRVDVLERGQTTARVRTTVTVFGAPVWAEHELVLVEGHWYGKHVQLELDDVTSLEG